MARPTKRAVEEVLVGDAALARLVQGRLVCAGPASGEGARAAVSTGERRASQQRAVAAVSSHKRATARCPRSKASLPRCQGGVGGRMGRALPRLIIRRRLWQHTRLRPLDPRAPPGAGRRATSRQRPWTRGFDSRYHPARRGPAPRGGGSAAPVTASWCRVARCLSERPRGWFRGCRAGRGGGTAALNSARRPGPAATHLGCRSESRQGRTDPSQPLGAVGARPWATSIGPAQFPRPNDSRTVVRQAHRFS